MDQNMMGFYQFSQNNSGGSIVVDEGFGIGDCVFIWADSFQSANKKAYAIGLFDLPYCECCGERFHEAYSPMTNGEEGSFFSIGKEINVFFHLPCGSITKVVITAKKFQSIPFVWNDDIIKQLTDKA